MVDKERIQAFNNHNYSSSGQGPVLYWMNREQRIKDNWGLLFAQELAKKNHSGVIILFTLCKELKTLNKKQLHFLLKGLEATIKEANLFHFPFLLLKEEPIHAIPSLIKKNKCSSIVTDFNPLKNKQQQQHTLLKHIDVPFFIVDSHNIVPCLHASEKEEFAAYTLRPKIHKHLPRFLRDIPLPTYQQGDYFPDIDTLITEDIANEAGIENWDTLPYQMPAGPESAIKLFESFLDKKLSYYASTKNDPNLNGESGLSPYLHFGHISSQRIAFETRQRYPDNENRQAFLEQLIIRKELADNYCYYNTSYDQLQGFRRWAQETLQKHSRDEREFLYTRDEFEIAQTHDDLWNAAQKQMIHQGKMHNYLRMYWSKKILEWSASPSEALATSIFLNNKYELDGQDPNGYTGCAWSIGGIHDRGWAERSIFGKIRYMNYAGCQRKFDVKKFIKQHLHLPTTSSSSNI